MAFTYDPSTDRGKVRMLITDRGGPANDPAQAIFQDAEIDAFLELESGSVRRAAASALDTIASDQALVLKVIVLLDLETDGAKVADALRKHAASLRAQEDSTGAFAIAEMVTNDFGAREYIWNQAQRGVL